MRYEEPQEVVVLGNQTARCSNRSSNSSSNSSKMSKKSVVHGRDTKSKATSKDIRAMFAKIARKNVEEQNEQQKDNITSVIIIE